MPVKVSHRTTPNDQTSTLLEQRSLRMTSGAIQATVPQNDILVLFWWPVWRLVPKSEIFRLSSSETKCQKICGITPKKAFGTLFGLSSRRTKGTRSSSLYFRTLKNGLKQPLKPNITSSHHHLGGWPPPNTKLSGVWLQSTVATPCPTSAELCPAVSSTLGAGND
uniref:Uncharacterized protein n=1 Tax=Romanomermis culicivorax TaxID=13658 RepID=A0A915KS47_ROMCU